MLPKLSLGVLASCLLLFTTLGANAASKRPNIIFILTDDQDNHMNTLDHMPSLQKHLVHQGTTFERHYCTVAICCPSRVNLWTGKAAHNTNVTDVSPPWGGYPKFVEGGFNDNHLALWMQQSGYNTYYSGKLFNSHTIYNYNDPPVRGYTGSNFFLDPFTYKYFNVSSTRDGQPPTNPVGKYSTDIVAEDAAEFLDRALQHPDAPFFLTLAPIAPHADSSPRGFTLPAVAPRHRGLFANYTILRTDNFNPETPSGVSWVAELPRLNSTEIDFNDEWQRRRLRALQAVDEIIEDAVTRLAEAKVLDNTFIIYASDNGYHISQHRMHPGKTCGFETDINVPLIIRGPGVPKGHRTRVPSSHTDLAPTIMHIAGNRIDDRGFDGAPIDLWGNRRYARSEHVAVEFWGPGRGEGPYGLRIEAEEYGFYYSVWCNNEKELYDMKRDPGQLNNLLSPKQNTAPPQLLPLGGRQIHLHQIANRLDALMMVLKSCKEKSCADPWGTLHPGGDVRSLRQALSPRFDTFYREQVKVSFTECELGYIVASEGPQGFNVFGRGWDGWGAEGMIEQRRLKATREERL
ncbi:Arylsulfatase [Cladobotryum mycophilum]|uniref:Arylsulfatase n=1 Tax=Cladobotryum mycophilum TaxID=491253 RepID=A0ABR0SU36_9HYPO